MGYAGNQEAGQPTNAHIASVIVVMDCADSKGATSHWPENPDARFKHESLSIIQYRPITPNGNGRSPFAKGQLIGYIRVYDPHELPQHGVRQAVERRTSEWMRLHLRISLSYRTAQSVLAAPDDARTAMLVYRSNSLVRSASSNIFSNPVGTRISLGTQSKLARCPRNINVCVDGIAP